MFSSRIGQSAGLPSPEARRKQNRRAFRAVIVVCVRAGAKCCRRAASAPLNCVEIMPADAIPPESFS